MSANLLIMFFQKTYNNWVHGHTWNYGQEGIDNGGGVYEILYYKKNGNAIWLQQQVVPIKSDNSPVALLLVTFRDITAFR